MESVLSNDHPSYGCEHAWFLFSEQRRGIVNRLILVEARTTYAVQTIERIVADDNMVNSFCELQTVIRNPDGIGIRSEFIELMDYGMFIAEVVDPAKIVNDRLTAAALQQSLLPDEYHPVLDRVAARVQESVGKVNLRRGREGQGKAKETEEKQGPQYVQDPRFNEINEMNSQNHDNAVAALVSMGFNRLQANSLVDSIGPQIHTMSLNDVVKQALKNNAT